MGRASSAAWVVPAKAVPLAVATGLGSGYLPVPGTCGTLLVFLFHRFLCPSAFLLENWLSGLIVIIVVVAVAVGSAELAERHYDVKDDHRINVDEIAGYLVAVYCLPAQWSPTIAAFFIFRFLDIVKPFPAGRSQDLAGGIGIVTDDVIAGLYTCLIVNAVYRLL